MKLVNVNLFFLLRIFLVLYFFIFISLSLNCDIITNPERRDGFGCQFYFIISAATYAELHNHTFHYKKFETLDHNYGKDPEFLDKKERLINFIGNFEIAEGYYCPPEICDFHYLALNINKCLNTDIFKKIKRIFRENKNRDDFFDKSKFHIAIALRSPNQNDVASYISNYPKFKYSIWNTYIKIINELKKAYSSYPVVFHIYSVGEIEEFRKIFKSKDIIFHINDSIEDTFTSMVFADILVTFPRSCFSYTAALLSDGIIYHFESKLMPTPSFSNWFKLRDSLREDWKDEYEGW